MIVENKNPVNHKKIGLLQSYMYRKRYSGQTIKSYVSVLRNFFFYIDKDSSKITNQDVNDYIEYLIFTRELSGSSHNNFLNAYVLYCKVNHPQNRLKFNQRPRKSEFIPEILSINEIQTLIKSIKNIKHRAIVAFIYCHGLRISECINFKLEHFDKQQNIIRIKQSKGSKDRNVEFNPNCRKYLVDYVMRYKPKRYLFNGQNNLPQYSSSSIRKFLKDNLESLGLAKRITPHSLRHSFATHMYDGGVPLDKLRIILGHKNQSTTNRYIKISKNSIKTKYKVVA